MYLYIYIHMCVYIYVYIYIPFQYWKTAVIHNLHSLKQHLGHFLRLLTKILKILFFRN